MRKVIWHADSKNRSLSLARFWGDYEGAVLTFKHLGALTARNQWHIFDGSELHCVSPILQGTRYSIIGYRLPKRRARHFEVRLVDLPPEGWSFAIGDSALRDGRHVLETSAKSCARGVPRLSDPRLVDLGEFSAPALEDEEATGDSPVRPPAPSEPSCRPSSS